MWNKVWEEKKILVCGSVTSGLSGMQRKWTIPQKKKIAEDEEEDDTVSSWTAGGE